MPISDKDRDRWALRGVRYEIADLESRLNELRQAEIDLSARIEKATGIVGDQELVSPATASQNGKAELRIADSTPKHEAAELVLHKIGKAARMPQIVNMLTEAGYGTHLDRQILLNSVYTAMARKPDTFVKVDRGTWSLTLWDRDWREAQKKTP